MSGFCITKLQRYTGGRKMEMGSGLLVEQKQALSVGQVQSLNILALNNQELEDFLMNEYLENPMLEIQKDDTEYVVPDILIARQNGQWEVTLNDGWMGEYRYNDYYIRMMEETKDPELQAYFRERLERARFVVNSVEQRRRTIVRIVEAVLELQKDYFEENGYRAASGNPCFYSQPGD